MRAIDEAWRRGLAPEPRLTVSQWADAERVLSGRASAEPGRWRTARTPYLREIMDCLSPSSPVERVVVVAGAQTGKTEAGLNFIGYVIGHAPGPAMMVQPTVEAAKRVSRQRLDALIEDTPALARLVRPARSRDSGNTVLSKEFPGGVLVMTGANSAVGLRSMPVRFLVLDEVDGFPASADDEGDPVALATARTATFSRRKILMVSTPTVSGLSRIEAAFGESDQRRFFVPCPYCAHKQVLKWSQVKWPEGRPEAADYACENCSAFIQHHHKTTMLAGGEWRATADGDGRTAGYHLSALYSPWLNWMEAARQFVAAGKNPDRLRVWVNTVLAETFRERGEAPDWRRLYERREVYPLGTIPARAGYLSAGADVQRDRIEVQVIAWGPGLESWSVDRQILEGSPSEPAVWRELDRLLAAPYPREGGGALHIARLAIDTGGHHTAEVYQWAARHPGRVMAVKGVDGQQVAVGTPRLVEVNAAGRRLRRGARYWPVGVGLLKSQLYGRLQLDAPEAGEVSPGYVHLPAGYDGEFYQQLCAEQLVRRQGRDGYTRLAWEKLRERNEALDTFVYALAAAIAGGLERWTDADWARAIGTGVEEVEAKTSVGPRMKFVLD